MNMHTPEIQVIQKRIKRTEKALAEARAERLHARLCGNDVMEDRWGDQVALAEKKLDGWHRAYSLLSGDDHDDA
jgi:hypothetical protein